MYLFRYISQVNLKLHYTQKFQTTHIDQLLDPHVDLKQQPENVFEKFSIGQVFKSVQVGANKMISRATIIEN